ncbi:hypothetical protein PCH_Pc22g12320 [Penicillium rubens Wisconsin 54-1255]|uniref:Uncharacterized protein n=1 Tax=Penicillium rubens (strain ATCC 28089 / DSM 1075 / NRRL 1951 / Wisconsin 54-1255) TaxID=500485 RepID=B6HRH4_PENRW|nr:hypothetical protein PCH_Pc22g12320 [Penicillium rubens Wisconsin 54-1255]
MVVTYNHARTGDPNHVHIPAVGGRIAKSLGIACLGYSATPKLAYCSLIKGPDNESGRGHRLVRCQRMWARELANGRLPQSSTSQAQSSIQDYSMLYSTASLSDVPGFS